MESGSRELKRGDVYYLRYDNSVGSEMSVGRPVLVVSNQGDIEKLNTVIVAFMTHTPRSGHGIVKLLLGGKPSYVMCNQLQTIDKSRLDTYMCTVEADGMKRISNSLALSMSYNAVIPKSDKEETKEETEEEIKLRVERDLFSKLYSKAMAELVELRFAYDQLKAEKSKPEPVVVKEDPVVVEEDQVVVDTNFLKRAMSTPNEELNSSGQVVVKTPRPKKSEGGRKSAAKNKRKANVNTDDWQTISEITSISRQTAQEIVACRNKYGKYEKLEDLLVVPRFGSGCMKKYGPMLEV